MALIGYARVSTEEQTHQPQTLALQALGCREIHEEQGSGGDRARPVLARLLDRITRGDTLVVVRIDRLARSLSHLLEVIERLEAKGAHFRSIEDPIDTASPQGKFTLQVLGAAAEFERALIRERTRAGLSAAREAGRIGGNPGLRDGDLYTMRKLAQARRDSYVDRLNDTATDWVPLVRRHRPDMAWQDLVRLVNVQRDPSSTPPWTQPRLLRAVHRYVAEGLLSAEVLGRAKPRSASDRLPALVAAMRGADREMTLQQICHRLEQMREPTPRGRSRWQPSSVRLMLQRAAKLGLL